MTSTLKASRELPSAFYAVGFVILYLRGFASVTSLFVVPDAVDKLLLVGGCFFLFAHCALNFSRYRGSVLACLLALGLFAVSYYLSGQTAPFVAALIVIASASIERPERVVRTWLAATLFLVLLIMLVYVTCLALDSSLIDLTYRREDGVVVSTRYAFFFNHPNMAGAVLMMMCCSVAYLRFDDLDLRHYVAFELVALFIVLVIDSKTSGLLTALLPPLAHLSKRGLLRRRGVRLVVRLLPVALFAATFLLAGPLYSSAMESSFTGRVFLWHACFESQGVTVLGQPLGVSTAALANGWIGYARTLDSLYAEGLFVHGLPFCALYCWVFWRRLGQEGDGTRTEALTPVLLTVLLFGFTEVHMLDVFLCFPLVLLSEGMLRNPRFYAEEHGRRIRSSCGKCEVL